MAIESTGKGRLSVGQCATFACVLEATAPKPGNVHRGADFEDLTYPDLIASGIVIGPPMENAPSRSLGETVLASVRATRRVVSSNSNLGMILLLAPLAAATKSGELSSGLRQVLNELTADDARDVYEAIRLARPGGLGKVSEGDVRGDPPASLVIAMRLAADRDLVARQYAGGFREVFDDVVPALRESLSRFAVLDAIVHAYLAVMAKHPDSLIARKCGREVAQRASDQAADIISAASPASDAWHERLADFDFWLRADGHRRNPGTTADLVTAGLFVELWEGGIAPPFDWTGEVARVRGGSK
jgi:triphosphoribosyl-dephospho-CoA synthase